MQKDKINAILRFIATTLFYAVAALNFVRQKDVSNGIFWLCIGTVWLCLALIASQQMKNSKKDE